MDALYVDRLKIVHIFMGDDVALSRDVDCFHRAGTNVAVCICYKLKKNLCYVMKLTLMIPMIFLARIAPGEK